MRGRVERRVWPSDPTGYAPPKYRRETAYDVFWPEPLAGFEPWLSPAVLAAVRQAEHAVRRLAGPAEQLLRDEAVASSGIEGLVRGPKALARAAVAARPDPVAAEILANVRAMQFTADAGGRALSASFIAEIHAELLRGGPQAGIAGQVRTTQNWLGGNAYHPGGAAFVPPPPEAVPGLLDDLCAFAAMDHLPALVQAAVVHAQFETVHPFLDGNGRTGRALIHAVLRCHGLVADRVLPISVALNADRDRYFAGLKAFRVGDVEGWVRDFVSAAARAAG